MIKFYLFGVCIIFIAGPLKAQNNLPVTKDTTKLIKDVVVRGYLSEQPVLSVPASVGIITQQQLNLQPDNSFISVLNSVPGVRAEERSPGSYRLSIRGSLLRSPFGIRDIKVYYDEIPLTRCRGQYLFECYRL